ncbi:DUF1127 domain-containing protein [Bradyrhizobium xenonodulans]|uniref:DUF1127 domain-containing protein n=1 Tax=Bradyrhizobium xenonodulans TaxID=2736875 RepID=A0ABY7MUE3_9BRAD|nr:DUF1127 domain-containing protein [Bradyrhizobium xenonodulans]WBL81072.1 DUF1127 domain-containing protein [Bradyrhizobium xenonodulans]
MSCNSAAGLTGPSATAFGPSPNLRWFSKLPLALLDTIARRRQYRELLELDDRLLEDIGVSRTMVAEARKSSFSDWLGDR